MWTSGLWPAVRRLLSGRAILDRLDPPSQPTGFELPEIEEVPQAIQADGAEKEHLRRVQALHETRLARLRTYARVRSTADDA